MGDTNAAEKFDFAVDLASRWLGASVMAANDESFGAKENLITPGKADFKPGNYTHSGEIVDGWETRRRRGEPGQDWVIVRLGCPGIVREIDVDTSFFTGNYPEHCRIEACGMEGYPSPAELQSTGTEWIEIVPKSPLGGDCHNLFRVDDHRRFTHVRLLIGPDGGVARLRVKGQPVLDPRLFDGLSVDLASQDSGGIVTGSSDGFYTSASMLNRPDRARTMGEGWETRRRRDNGNDYAIIKLGIAGHVRLVEIDTAHFKHNASGQAMISGHVGETLPGASAPDWKVLMSRRHLEPDTRHLFPVPARESAMRWIKLDAFPDGGISRMRIWGAPDAEARKRAGLLWFNSLPTSQCLQVLGSLGVAANESERIAAQRPLVDLGASGNARSVDLDVLQSVMGQIVR